MKKKLTLSVESYIIKKGKELAKKDNRSLSNYIEKLILEKS